MALKRTKIVIVGCGPGGLDYLTPIARREIEQAEVLVGAPRLLDAFPECRAARIAVRADIENVLDKIAQQCHRRIAVLVTGDPGLCSLAKPVIARFGKMACRVIPGISSVQAAFARVGVDWFNARVINAHDRIPKIDPAALKQEEKIAVLAGSAKARPWLAALAGALKHGHRVFLCTNLTLPDETIQTATAATLARRAFPARTIVLLIRKEQL
jgi:precorrin-6y C5,15-methyltransferase (decarboxylating) CbiE subunit